MEHEEAPMARDINEPISLAYPANYETEIKSIRKGVNIRKWGRRIGLLGLFTSALWTNNQFDSTPNFNYRNLSSIGVGHEFSIVQKDEQGRLEKELGLDLWRGDIRIEYVTKNKGAYDGVSSQWTRKKVYSKSFLGVTFFIERCNVVQSNKVYNVGGSFEPTITPIQF